MYYCSATINILGVQMSQDKDEEQKKVIKPDHEPKSRSAPDSEHELMSMFESWMKKYWYFKDLEERKKRFEAFKETVRIVEKNDPSVTGVTLGVNSFACLTDEEFHDIYLCCVDPSCNIGRCSNKTGSCSEKTGSCSEKTDSPSCQTMPLCSDAPIGVLGKKPKSTKKKKKLKSRLT
ncbi:hypothetical protein ACJIZ3_023332 [Penstemon smallii]|uniref:Cathepsin propeptide inhibitor domain-containing protein n=1 Tax=Penstemon smallii TaxID=265156 RepID=A0ABD3TQ62_9LAMI